MRGKAAVERAFGVIRQLLLAKLPGYTGVDVADRGVDPGGRRVPDGGRDGAPDRVVDRRGLYRPESQIYYSDLLLFVAYMSVTLAAGFPGDSTCCFLPGLAGAAVNEVTGGRGAGLITACAARNCLVPL
jgi:hypothetical protein